MAKKQNHKTKDKGLDDDWVKTSPDDKLARKILGRKTIKATKKHLKQKLKQSSLSQKKGQAVPHYNTKTLIIMPVVYEFVRQYLMADERDLLYKKAKKAGVKLSATLNKNPFNVGLSLLVSEKKLSTQDRSKYAIQMAYAYRHDVTAIWLIAFLLRSGGDAKIKRRFREEKFEPWLKARPKYPLNKDPKSALKPNEPVPGL